MCPSTVTRRGVVATLLAASGTVGHLVAKSSRTDAAEPALPAIRDFSAGALPVPYPDPDVLVVHPSFNALRVFNAPIQRLWTGALWSGGPGMVCTGTLPGLERYPQ